MTDAAHTEYAVMSDAEGRSEQHASEGLLSLAAFLRVPLSVLLEMPAEERCGLIERRNLARGQGSAAELRRYAERRMASP